MKKHLTLLLSLFSLLLSAQYPVLDTAFHYGNYTSYPHREAVVIEDMRIDAQGNKHVVGIFVDTLDLDPGPGVTAVNTNEATGFIQKLDKRGHLIWGKTWTAPNGVGIDKIRLDSQGNIILIGNFRGQSFDANPNSGTFYLTGGGTNDYTPFLLKLTSTGNYSWATSYPGALFRSGNTPWNFGIAINSKDEVIVGFFYDSIIDTDPRYNYFNYVSAHQLGRSDLLIQKLDANGGLVWNRILEGDASIATGVINCDQQDNIYVAGGYRAGTIDFDPDSTAVQNRGRNSSRNKGFLLKLNGAGLIKMWW